MRLEYAARSATKTLANAAGNALTNGSARTNNVDERLVAATNCDLERLMEDKQFRRELYRLNVSPIRIPPLRDRREDIPLLVQYFTEKYALRMKKHIDTIPSPQSRNYNAGPGMAT